MFCMWGGERTGMEKKRLEYIDIARGIGIVLVVLGHCLSQLDGSLRTFIYSFHMPLFFTLAGMTHKTTECSDIRKCVLGLLKKRKAIFRYYILFNGLYLAWDLTTQNGGGIAN